MSENWVSCVDAVPGDIVHRMGIPLEESYGIVVALNEGSRTASVLWSKIRPVTVGEDTAYAILKQIQEEEDAYILKVLEQSNLDMAKT